MGGFYKSKYNDVDLSSTLFEPTDVIQAFPCFDLPIMNAAFSISTEAPEGFIAFSSGAEAEKKDGKLILEKTSVMSTYIVAYVIG